MSRILLAVAVAAAISGCASKSPPTMVSQSAAPQPAAAVPATTPQEAVMTAYVVQTPQAVVPAPYGLEYFRAPRDSGRARCIRMGGVWRPTARECEMEVP